MLQRGQLAELGGAQFLEAAGDPLSEEQIEALKTVLMTAPPSKEQTRDIDFLLCLGELFTLVAYGQLIIEKGKMDGMGDDMLEQIFDFMVREPLRQGRLLEVLEEPGAHAGLAGILLDGIAGCGPGDLLVSVTEKRTAAEIERLAAVLTEHLEDGGEVSR